MKYFDFHADTLTEIQKPWETLVYNAAIWISDGWTDLPGPMGRRSRFGKIGSC